MKRPLLVVSCAVLLLIVTGFWIIGRPAYRRSQESRALRQAVNFLQQGDLRYASLSARRALTINPRNLEACEVMAKLAELGSSPQMLDWRRRIVELSPTLENRLSLAATALRVEASPYALA